MINHYPKTLAALISCLVVVLIIINVVVSAQVSYWGYELGQLESNAAHREEANRLLSQDISKQTSLNKFQKHAQSLGYNSDVAYNYINAPESVALNPIYAP